MASKSLRKYGVEATFNFVLHEVDGVDFRVDASHASGDTKIMKDNGAEANTTNGFTDEGTGYSIVLSATEMQAARIVVYIVDQSTKAWLDTHIEIETYGHASAQHAFDLDDAVRGGMTALPNAAADAAGGLPISDAGGLNIDSIKTDTTAILVDTGELGSAVGASLSADIAAIKTETASILTDTGEIGTAGAGLTDLGGMSTGMKAEVNAEVVDTLTTDTYAEPAQGTPGATISMEEKISYIYKFLRNRVTVTGTTISVYNDDATTVDHQSTHSDGSGTYDRGEFTTGA